jgi:hypothetical protein
MEDATTILKIPLQSRDSTEYWSYGVYTVDGIYNVKSAYYRFVWIQWCLLNQFRLLETGIKCRYYLRVLTSALEEFNAFRFVSCVIDKLLMYSTYFFRCEQVVKCWQETKLWNYVQPLFSSVDMFQGDFFLSKLAVTIEQLNMFIMSLWSIWKCRNQSLWEGYLTSPKKVARL